MDWTVLVSPQVVTPATGLLGVLVGVGISSWTTHINHRERLVAEQALAERKFVLDQSLVIWRRRFDLAEQVLAAAYEARAALNWARGRAIFSGEGETRKPTEPESDKVREARNTAFIPIERLARNAKAFAAVQTLQYIVASHFGEEAVKALAAIIEAHHGITSAASILTRMAEADEDWSARQSLLPVRAAIWGDGADTKLDAAIKQIEAICKPILSGKAPT